MSKLAVSLAVVLEGHLIDSLTLAKVIDIIQQRGGDYTLNHIQVGNQKHDTSSAHLTITAPDDATLQALLNELASYGVKAAGTGDTPLAFCGAHGEPPQNALAIRLPVSTRANGQWIAVEGGGQALYLATRTSGGQVTLRHKNDLTAEDLVVLGQAGVRWS